MFTRHKRNLFYFLITPLIFFAFSPMVLAAEKYPSRTIQLVTSKAPGGFMTISIQLIIDNIGKNLGVPMVLNYKTGGRGATGVNFLCKSKPDGYTIGCFDVMDIVFLPASTPSIPYKYSDLDPLCKYYISPIGVYCKRDAPWNTLEDFVADAKKRPGQITYGAAPNTQANLAMEGFLKAAGINIMFVPTEAAGQTIIRVLGGNLDLGVSGLSPAVGQLKAGTMKALFLLTPNRVSPFPQIPALKESGYPDPIMDLYAGFFAPLGMPKPIRETLVRALEKTIKDPPLKKKLEEVTLALDYLPSEPFAKGIEEDHKRVTNFLKTTDFLK